MIARILNPVAGRASDDHDHGRVLVKICGVSRPEHADVAALAGADLIGVVFYPPSPRNVTVDEARAVAGVARAAGLVLVGLFVNESPDVINSVADQVGLDVVQLSGDEAPDVIRDIERPTIGSVRIDSTGHVDEEGRFSALASANPGPWAIHIDSHVRGMYGGTGTVADWFVAADFARRYRTILAGGLRPETVVEAIRRVRPFAVDVSSGVETGGLKDPVKIRAFISSARSAAIEARKHGINIH
ncbi:MAG TPA: phosphoribosylanthranilate isomerase [Thermomicrobiales bacterium]|nr:phosphoribosylanthranilate isomerase [Thermomicrobiales bacterium]